MGLLVQFFLLGSAIVLVAMPLAFVVLGGHCLVTGKYRHSALMTGSFILGALLSGVLVWQWTASEGSLPFWTTLQAAADAQTYGQAVEHHAEGVVTLMSFAAVLGGAACSAAVALGTRLVNMRAHL